MCLCLRRLKMISFSSFIVSLVSFICFVVFVYKWFLNPASSTSKKRLPPCPRKLPMIGNLHQLGLYPHRSLQALSKHHGPLMMLHLGSFPAVIVSSADVACEIMKNQDLIFSNRPKSSISNKTFYGKDIAFSHYGKYWRQMKSICVLHLLSNKRVQSFRYIREEETSLMIEKIRQSCSSSSLLKINLSDILVSLNVDIMCRVALGKKFSDGEQSMKYGSILKEVSELLGIFNVEDYIPWLKWINNINGLNTKVEKTTKVVDEFLSNIIEEHRSRKQGNSESGAPDLVDIMLELRSEDNFGFAIEIDAIKAVTLDMFAAGTDTTSITLEWTIAELLKHPKSMQKLQNEVRQVAGNKSEISEEDLEKMPYLNAVLKESLRLHPPVPLLIPRESTQDTKIMGYDIRARTRVMVNYWAIARDPKVWEDPDEFNPERFFNTGKDFKGFDFEFIPFGAGRRSCPGITFAVFVYELALAKLVHKFNFDTQQDLDMAEAPGITVHKKSPLLIVATPHEAN